MMPRALLLDFDGTLVDWLGALQAGVHAAAAELSRAHGLDATEVASRTLAFEAEVFESHATGWNLGGVDAPQLHRAIWRRALAEYGLDEASAPELAEVQWHAELAAYRAFDDVAALLDAADEAGVRTALVTNGPGVVQRAKLAQLGLVDAFDAVLVSAEVGTAKPDARIFEGALAAIGARAEEAWHVGDSLEYDVAGAHAAGLAGVWVNRNDWSRGRHQPEPELEISSLDELTRLLARAA